MRDIQKVTKKFIKGFPCEDLSNANDDELRALMKDKYINRLYYSWSKNGFYTGIIIKIDDNFYKAVTSSVVNVLK
ncbi:hypothetical protein [Veillonella ratti]|uniref:hypothetical protein n=1 Tax=Veillonella ratti TaxID=103892 RepID=UPI0034A532A6